MARLAASLRQEVAPVPTDVKDPTDPNRVIKVDARTGRKIGDAPSKGSGQLPASVLKVQNDELDAVGIAASIQSDLGAVLNQVESGALRVGPIRNAANQARNFAGLSTEESRNYNTFKTTLEKLRNDSLRLNKGVQTEGDSQRAWNELMGSINDPGVVKQRLREIMDINERAVNLRKMKVDTMRQNFGVGPLDMSGFENQPAAVGGGAAAPRPMQPATGQQKRKRYNPQTRSIEEY